MLGPNLLGEEIVRPQFSLPIKQLLNGAPSVGRLPPVTECGTLFVNALTDEIEYYPRNAGLLEIEAAFGYFVQSYSKPFVERSNPITVTFVAMGGAPQVPLDRYVFAVAAYAGRNRTTTGWRGLYNGDIRHTANVLSAGMIEHAAGVADSAVVFDESGTPSQLLFWAVGGNVRTLSGRPYEMVRGSAKLPFSGMKDWQVTSVHPPVQVDRQPAMTVCLKRIGSEERAKALFIVRVADKKVGFFPIDLDPRPLGSNRVPIGPVGQSEENFLFMDEYGSPVLVPMAEVVQSMARAVRNRVVV